MEGAKSKLKKVSENIFEIPKEGNMKVPGRIFMNEKLLENVQDKTIQQVMNVATLPGIYGRSIAMPDAHMGYGFSVGGVAATDAKCGCISPGGVGYDINCLHPEVITSLKHGTWLRIKDVEERFDKTNFRFFNENSELKDTNLLFFMKKQEKEMLYEIRTHTDHEIKVTGDHPILTQDGMKPAKDLDTYDHVYVHSFEGVEYEEPSEEILLTLKDVEKVLDNLGVTNKGSAKSQVLKYLRSLNILPLKYNSSQTPVLLKIIGFILGDGVVSFSEKHGGQVIFYAKEEDLEAIKKDLDEIGITTPNISSRDRSHSISTSYKAYSFDTTETSLHKKSTGFAALLIALGCPYGNKTHQEYRVPEWIMKSPLWYKRLFIASFFGAELSTPNTLNKFNFYELQLNMNKSEKLKNNAVDYLNDLRILLSELDVQSREPVTVKGNSYDGKKGKTIGLRIQILGNPENLMNFFKKVNYEYNREKHKKACLAYNYLKLKERAQSFRSYVRDAARQMQQEQVPVPLIVKQLEGQYTSKQFVKKSLYSTHAEPRIALDFPSFGQYCEKCSIGEEGLAKVRINSIEKKDYSGWVYDVTMNDDNHTFIANNLVVSNCGVRLLRTSLDKEEVYPKVKEVLNELFRRVPCGVGKGGELRLSQEEFKEVLTKGAKWAVENGIGNQEDLENCEENGTHKDAVPEYIGPKPFKRGKEQLGTLGAGNHFLEVQYVDKIFNPQVAKVFGIEKEGQVVVMIHCGSRGVGHQVCSDYLRQIEKELPEVMSNLVDRELAYAPSDSELGQKYYGAMCAAANYAWCNRHVIGHHIKETFKHVFKTEDVHTVYDVAHNMAKKEKHMVDGEETEVYVHRKGATRSFPAGREEICEKYRAVGQPVLIPGSMGTASYVLVGGDKAMEVSFGSTAHGAGRVMSRRQAKETFNAERVTSELENKNIIIKSASWKGIVEEAPGVYKDVDEVVKISDALGIGKLVARLRPMGVVKG
jgi:tRNA-splicing ligase RtcB (3'-phosphate/5'-hydroxy nucleic acid ligase)